MKSKGRVVEVRGAAFARVLEEAIRNANLAVDDVSMRARAPQEESRPRKGGTGGIQRQDRT